MSRTTVPPHPNALDASTDRGIRWRMPICVVALGQQLLESSSEQCQKDHFRCDSHGINKSHLKMDGWNMNRFLLGWPVFWGDMLVLGSIMLNISPFFFPDTLTYPQSGWGSAAKVLFGWLEIHFLGCEISWWFKQRVPKKFIEIHPKMAEVEKSSFECLAVKFPDLFLIHPDVADVFCVWI